METNCQLRDSDVCCGRGKGFWNHPGNKMFHKIIRASAPQYAGSKSKNEKSTIVHSIVIHMLKSGARFVRLDKATGQWHDIGESQAHDKTGHAIRDYIINQRKQEAGQTFKKYRKCPGQPLQASNLKISSVKPYEMHMPMSLDNLAGNLAGNLATFNDETAETCLPIHPTPLPCTSQGRVKRCEGSDIPINNLSYGYEELTQSKQGLPQCLTWQELRELCELLSEDDDDEFYDKKITCLPSSQPFNKMQHKST